ncbi:MAG: Acylphosphatase [Gammaproteobacteria bacterium]|nr:Acylphosphatase [Gammaproteobacteria bacterium]
MGEQRSSGVCNRYRVFGRVQGVWFRGTTRDQARQLGLSGWVRNCKDGSVETVACGTPEALDAFKSWLQRGPSSARVDRIEETDASESPRTDDFVIKP